MVTTPAEELLAEAMEQLLVKRQQLQYLEEEVVPNMKQMLIEQGQNHKKSLRDMEASLRIDREATEQDLRAGFQYELQHQREELTAYQQECRKEAEQHTDRWLHKLAEQSQQMDSLEARIEAGDKRSGVSGTTCGEREARAEMEARLTGMQTEMADLRSHSRGSDRVSAKALAEELATAVSNTKRHNQGLAKEAEKTLLGTLKDTLPKALDCEKLQGCILQGSHRAMGQQ